MKKRFVSIMLIGISLAFVGCGKESLTEDRVNLSSDKEISKDGNYVVVVELREGIKDVEYILTENGKILSIQEGVHEGLRENIMSNKANGEYSYELTVKDGEGNTVTKGLSVKVDNSIATLGNIDNSNLSEWSGDSVEYKVDDNIKYKDKKYKCLQGHKSQDDWTPVSATSLWKEIK